MSNKAYNLLSEFLRQEVERPIEGGNYLFIGFSHLTPLQVDLIKSLGIRNDVLIPVYSEMLKIAHKSDWISWLENIDDYVIEKKEEIRKLNYAQFAPNRMAETLIKLDKELDGKDFYLATKDLELSECNEIPYADYIFKVADNIFQDTNIELIEHVRKNLFTDEKSKIDHNELVGILKEILKKTLKEKNKNFREIKSILNFTKMILNWKELTAKNKNISKFILEVFEQILALDSPRSYDVPVINNEDHDKKIQDLKLLEFCNSKREVVLCVSSLYSSNFRKRSFI